MFCHKCGYKLKEGSIFCSKCGVKVVDSPDDNIMSSANYDVLGDSPIQDISYSPFSDATNENINNGINTNTTTIKTNTIENKTDTVPVYEKSNEALKNLPTDDKTEKGDSLVKKVVNVIESVASFVFILVGMVIFKAIGKSAAHDKTISYMLPAIFAGIIGAVITYVFIDRLEYFNGKILYKIILSAIVLVIAILTGVKGAIISALLVMVLSYLLSKNMSK